MSERDREGPFQSVGKALLGVVWGSAARLAWSVASFFVGIHGKSLRTARRQWAVVASRISLRLGEECAHIQGVQQSVRRGKPVEFLLEGCWERQ